MTTLLLFQWILGAMGLDEFLPSNWLMDWLASFACEEGSYQGICESVLFVLCGFDEAQVPHLKYILPFIFLKSNR
jgi:hypothetical protein